jgi:hypothetical protein
VGTHLARIERERGRERKREEERMGRGVERRLTGEVVRRPALAGRFVEKAALATAKILTERTA